MGAVGRQAFPHTRPHRSRHRHRMVYLPRAKGQVPYGLHDMHNTDSSRSSRQHHRLHLLRHDIQQSPPPFSSRTATMGRRLRSALLRQGGRHVLLSSRHMGDADMDAHLPRRRMRILLAHLQLCRCSHLVRHHRTAAILLPTTLTHSDRKGMKHTSSPSSVMFITGKIAQSIITFPSPPSTYESTCPSHHFPAPHADARLV